MKWFYLAQPINSPAILPAGTMRLVDDRSFGILRDKHGPSVVLNVTPRWLGWYIRALFGREHEMPESTAKIMPCPDCTRFNFETRRFEVFRELTYCYRCDGLHAVVTA